MDTILLAMIADRMNLLIWQNTKDGHKNRNRPPRIADSLLGRTEERQEEKPVGFLSGEAFAEAYGQITRR